VSERRVGIGVSPACPSPSPAELRLQDSNLDRTAPKADVLPLHQGGLHRRQVCQSSLPPVTAWRVHEAFTPIPHPMVIMNPNRIPLFAALPVIAILGLTACTAPAAGPTDDETYVSDSAAPGDTPAPVLTPNPIEADTTLIVRATATAANGSQVGLEMQVHRSIAWDDVASQTLPAALLEDCASLFTGEQFATEQWSFTRVNVTAIPTAASTADWPSDATITLAPSAEFVPVAGRGDLQSAGTNAEPLCQRDVFLAGPGRGGLAFGIPGDGTSLTAWAGHTFGFRVAGADLTDCTSELTAEGGSRGGGSGWTSEITDGACVIGSANEVAVG